MMMCGLVDVCRCFRGMCHFHIQGRRDTSTSTLTLFTTITVRKYNWTSENMNKNATDQ
jgi:hypothetical protein